VTEEKKSNINFEKPIEQREELLHFFEEEQQQLDVPDFDEEIVCENPFV